MFKFLRELREFREARQLENIVLEKITKEDVNNICGLYLDPRYKSLAKLNESIIISLVQKSFKECTKEEEFLGVKWAVSVCKLWLSKPKEYYITSIKHASSKGSEKSGLQDSLQDIADGTYGVEV